MSAEPQWYDRVVMPALLAAARRTYGLAIRQALADAGFDDMPRTGARVVGGIARNGPSVGDLAVAYGVSKQAASQLVDTLVARGYVERVPDEEDRRRMLVRLTERGEAAAREIRAAVGKVDEALAGLVDEEDLAQTRSTLGALVELAPRSEGDHEFPPRPPKPKRAAGPPTRADGKICYLQIPADDVRRSAEFYSSVFGWRVRERSDGALAFDDTTGEVSGSWVTGRPPSTDPGLLVYVMVDSVEAALAKVVAAGGRVVQPIGADAPEVTARFADPAGNVVGLYQEPSPA